MLLLLMLVLMMMVRVVLLLANMRICILRMLVMLVCLDVRPVMLQLLT